MDFFPANVLQVLLFPTQALVLNHSKNRFLQCLLGVFLPVLIAGFLCSLHFLLESPQFIFQQGIIFQDLMQLSPVYEDMAIQGPAMAKGLAYFLHSLTC